MWRVTKLGACLRCTWNDAVVRWLTEQSHKASPESEKIHLRWLDRRLNGPDLTSIRRERLDQVAPAMQNEEVTSAAVNRVMEVLRAIFGSSDHGLAGSRLQSQAVRVTNIVGSVWL